VNKEEFDTNIKDDAQELGKNIENVIIYQCNGICFKYFSTPHCVLHFANFTHKTRQLKQPLNL
jgi:hypothetical protein